MKYATLVLFLTLSSAAAPALADHREQGGSHDHAAHSAPAAAKPTVSPTFAALDKDKDGFLSKAEMAKHPMAAHFGMMDTTKDGKLSPREFSSM